MTGKDSTDGANGADNETRLSRLNRRKMLGGIASTAALGMAGCTGNGGGDGGDTPMSTPTPRVVRETVVKTVEAEDDFDPVSVELNLDWVPKGDYVGFFNAYNQEYWADAGISVQITRGQGGDQVVQNVGNRNAMFGFAGTAISSQAVAGGLNIKFYTPIYYKSPVVLMARPELGIEEPADLEGTHGIVTAGGYEAQFTTFANTVGIDLDSIRVEPRGFVDVDVLVSKEADWTMQPYPDMPALRTQDVEVDAFNWFNEHLDFLYKGVVVNERFAEERPEAVRRFLEGAVRGWQYTLQNGKPAVAEAIDVLFNLFPNAALSEAPEMDAKEFHRQNAALVCGTLFTDDTREHGLGIIPEERARSTVDMYNQHLLDSEITAEDLFALDYWESGEYSFDFDAALDEFSTVGGHRNILLDDVM